MTKPRRNLNTRSIVRKTTTTTTPRKRNMKKGSAERQMRCKKVIEELTNHERNPWIYKRNCGNGKVAFAVKKPDSPEILYTGLTKRLKYILYPETEENPMFKSNQQRGRKPKYYKPSAIKKEKPATCGLSGAEHGKLVHSQIDFYVRNLKKNPTLTLDDLYPNGCDKCVKSVLRLIQLKQWRIVATEFEIADDRSRVATAIDLLVYDTVDKNLLILELKTGYEGEEYGEHPSDEPFPEPFDSIKNCPKNRHFLQIMGMIEILKRQYKVQIDGAHILRVLPKTKSMAVLNKMPSWTKSKINKDNLYEMLCDSN